jgi:hypothetical protein
VLQEHDYSCGQACVAEVIDYMGEASNDTARMRSGLTKFGLKSKRRLVQFRGNAQYRSHEKLDFYALLKMVHRKPDGGY